jgi:hypothetical protein
MFPGRIRQLNRRHYRPFSPLASCKPQNSPLAMSNAGTMELSWFGFTPVTGKVANCQTPYSPSATATPNMTIGPAESNATSHADPSPATPPRRSQIWQITFCSKRPPCRSDDAGTPRRVSPTGYDLSETLHFLSRCPRQRQTANSASGSDFPPQRTLARQSLGRKCSLTPLAPEGCCTPPALAALDILAFPW